AGTRKRSSRGARRLVLVLVAVSVLGFLAPRLPGGNPSGPMTALAGVLATAITLALLRSAAPKALWRYHGAEHKAVTAHEAGFEPTDVDAAMFQPRVHPRCGTN